MQSNTHRLASKSGKVAPNAAVNKTLRDEAAQRLVTLSVELMDEYRLHEDPSRTTPIGLARYATEFFRAAIAADDKLGNREGFELVAPVPVMFLVGQAIELALKAFLLHKGVELKKRRQNYGHELHRALRKAKELGLLEIVPLTKEDEAVVELLNSHYASKQLQYIVSGAKTYPVFGPLESVGRRIVFGIGPAVGYVAR